MSPGPVGGNEEDDKPVPETGDDGWLDTKLIESKMLGLGIKEGLENFGRKNDNINTADIKWGLERLGADIKWGLVGLGAGIGAGIGIGGLGIGRGLVAAARIQRED